MKLTDVCRLCLIKKKELFFPIDKEFEKKFYEITNLNITIPDNHEQKSNFPSEVCIPCIKEFDQHYNKHCLYRNGLIENQKRLNKLLGNNSEVSQIKDNIKHETQQEDEIYFELEDNEEYELESLQEANEMTKSEEELHDDSVSYSCENYDECENTPEDTFETELEEQEVDINNSATEVEENFNDEEHQSQNENETFIEQLDDNYEEQEEGCDEFEVCIATTDRDEEIIVYDQDIAMEELPSKVKRKYVKRPKDTPKPFRCWIKNCGIEFSFRTTMKRHMYTVHSLDCDSNTCFVCGSRFGSSADFLAHMKTHTRKAQCDICKCTFTDDKSLQRHISKNHTKGQDERKFACEICGARFKRKEHVSSHLVYRHSSKDDRKFFCKECPSTFLTKQDLRNHEKSHQQVKIKCEYCPYDCRDLKSIRRHCEKLHNTNKIYKCACDKMFEAYRDLQSHKRRCSGAALIDSTTDY
ncbi:CLUMA_CG017891, isoform A [Clunio marinus]|uniref:CLUMA_CG017891, isoform A n=1 Tax=Clunio marinus TaxID=568069 RepID=A0A1J1J0A5_9DIPT|nr:CLUMA_CG017891, isoform A [Clunio marinus]